MRRVIVRVVLFAIVVGVVMAPLVALGEEQPCRRDGDRVTCAADAFKVLTDSCVQYRADAKACGLRLDDALKDVAAREVELHACQAALAAVPPPPPPPSAIRPLAGYAVGVVSTVAMLVGVVADIPTGARLTLAGVGLVGLAGGAVLVLP